MKWVIVGLLAVLVLLMAFFVIKMILDGQDKPAETPAETETTGIDTDAKAGKFEEKVRDNDYQGALEVYEKKISGNSKKEVEAAEFLEEYLEAAWQSYLDETMSKTDFDAVLQTVQKIDRKLDILGRSLSEIENEYPEVSESKEAYQEGIEALENGDYEVAMTSFAQVSPADEKNYEAAQDRYAEAEEAYLGTITDAVREKLNAADYDGAANLIRAAERTVGMQSQFESLKKEIATTRFEMQMRAHADSGNFASMEALYDQALSDDYCVISADMTQLYSEAQQAFREDIIDRSINAYKNNGYESAIAVISEGLAAMPNDNDLQRYYELFFSCSPRTILDLNIIDTCGSVDRFDSRADVFGNIYSNCCLYDYDYWVFQSNPTYQELLLGGSYSTFSGSVFVDSETNRDSVISLKIYADGVPVFDSGAMNRQTDAKSFSIDVSNVRIIKIEANFSSAGKIVLGDTVLTRTLTDAELYG